MVGLADIGGKYVSYLHHGFDEGHGENVPVVYENGTIGQRRDYYFASKANKMVDDNWNKLYEGRETYAAIHYFPRVLKLDC
jgi:hypothetical protein